MMQNPHLGRPIEFRGSDPVSAGAAVVLLHGRRQTADDIFACAERIDMSNIHYAMPIADQSTWYPRSFMRPLDENEPRLGNALAAVEESVRLLGERGFTRDRIVLMGFSQGACLACEYVYRNPCRWGGLIAFTGGLFGPEGTIWKASGSLHQTPVFLGIGDPDEWIPLERVRETAGAFRVAGAEVRERVYPGIGHRVCDEEIAEALEILAAVEASPSQPGTISAETARSGASL